MSPDRLRACLEALQLDLGGLAAILHYQGDGQLVPLNTRDVRHWTAGTRPVPPELSAWLERQVVRPGPRPSLSKWKHRKGDDPPPVLQHPVGATRSRE